VAEKLSLEAVISTVDGAITSYTSELVNGLAEEEQPTRKNAKTQINKRERSFLLIAMPPQ
jgi:hypothetical protein